MMVNLGIGLFTSVGTNLYVACAVGHITLGDLSKGIYPYVVWSAIALILITYFPQTVLFLPNLLMK
jgi:C4-dicarboxylate transporter DctM subunit